MAWPNVLLLLALLAGQTRSIRRRIRDPGTTPVFENDVIAVWDVVVAQAEIPAAHASLRPDRRVLRRGRPHHHAGRCPGPAHQHQALGVSVERRRQHARRGRRERPADARDSDGSEDSRAWRRRRGAGRRPAPGPRRAVVEEQAGRDAWAIPPGTAAPMHRHVKDAVELIFDGSTPARTPKVVFVPAGTVHAGPRRRSRRPRVHLRNQITRGDETMKATTRTAFVPGDVWSGGRRRCAAAGRIRAGGRQREAGVEPVRAAHHRSEVRLRARQPVREGPHQPGHLGLRRGGRRHRRHLQPRPELRPAHSRPESAQRAPDLRAGAQGRRLRRRAGRRVRRGADGGGNGAVGSGRQGAERAGVSAARRQVPRQDPRLLRHGALSGAAADAGACSPRRRPRPSRTATPR